MSRRSLYNRFSQDVRDAILRSREEAMRLGCPHIDTHHIFLAMLHATDNPALHILNTLKVNRPALMNTLEERYRLGPRVDVPGNMPLTVVAERALKGTYHEAVAARCRMIDTGILMLSMLRIEKADVTQVMNAAFGVDYVRACEARGSNHSRIRRLFSRLVPVWWGL